MIIDLFFRFNPSHQSAHCGKNLKKSKNSLSNLGVVKKQNCYQKLFLKMFIRSPLVKIHNFHYPTPLAFSPSVNLRPPKLVFDLYLAKYRSYHKNGDIQN